MLNNGESEQLKGGVHAAAALLMAVCAGYNMLACRRRRQCHLAVNAVAYVALTAWEMSHTWHHWSSR